MHITNFNPFGNFLFDEAQYEATGPYGRLRVKCIVCGKERFVQKRQIENLLNSDPKEYAVKGRAIKYCGLECNRKASDAYTIIECECAQCHRKFERPKSRIKPT